MNEIKGHAHEDCAVFDGIQSSYVCEEQDPTNCLVAMGLRFSFIFMSAYQRICNNYLPGGNSEK